MMTVAETPTFGELLSRLRLARGLTQEELAARAGMSVRGISDLERGLRRRPQATTISGLADALGLAPEDRELFERSARASLRLAARSESSATGASPAAPSINSREAREGIETARQALEPPGAAVDPTSPGSPWASETPRRPSSRRGTLPGGGVRAAGRAKVVLVAVILIATTAGWILSNHHHGTQSVRAAGVPVAGAPLWIWSGTPSQLQPFRDPQGIAVSRDGSVYVSDATTNRITRFSSSGQLLGQWGATGSGPQDLRGPRGIAVDRLGNVYVADTGNSRVTEFSPLGKPLTHWGPASAQGDDAFVPGGIAVATNGLLFVVNSADGRVETFSPSGNQLAQCCPYVPNFLPSGIAVGNATERTNGTVYVTDAANETVQMLPMDGTSAEGSLAGGGPGILSSPVDVAVDRQGNLYVLDSITCHVVKFSPTGDFLESWGRCGDRAGEFREPHGIAVDRRDDLYIADTGNNRVQKVSSTGKPLAIMTVGSSTTQRLSAPRGLALGMDGTIYVADTGNDRILALSSRGELAGSWGGAQRFAGPTGVAVGVHGVAYVAEPFRDRIESFIPISRNRTIPRPFPESPAGFNNPSGVAVDTRGNLYVADSLHDWVQEFSPSGKILTAWQLSSIWTHFNATALAQTADAVAVDSAGNVYVADASRDLIEKLSPEKMLLRRWGGTGIGPGKLLAPAGLAVDSEGHVYVADSGNNRIDQFSSDGTLLKAWGTEGSGPGQFRNPMGVAVDANGNVYVADTGNSRIQRFSSLRGSLEFEK